MSGEKKFGSDKKALWADRPGHLENHHRRRSFQPGLQDESLDNPDSHRVVDASQLDRGMQNNGGLRGTKRLGLEEGIFEGFSENVYLKIVTTGF